MSTGRPRERRRAGSLPRGERPPERDRDAEARARAERRTQARTRERGRERAPRRRQQERAPRRHGSDLLRRIAVAVPLAIIAIGFVDVGGLAFTVLVALVSVLCLHELYRMLARWKPVPLVGYAAAVAMVLAAHFGTERTVLGFAMAALPVTFLGVLAAGQGGMATVSVAGTLLGVYWIGFAFAHAELLRGVTHGDSLVLDVMIGTFVGDTGAYLGGRLFGRRALAPEISPNKTVEGLFLGMLAAVIAVFVAGLYQTWMTATDAIALGLAIAVLGPIGDLFESLVKREAGTKDSGTLLGAHGGALDRLDALVFTVVAGYYVWAVVIH